MVLLSLFFNFNYDWPRAQDPTTRVRSRLYATYSYAETGEHHGVAPGLIHDSRSKTLLFGAND